MLMPSGEEMTLDAAFEAQRPRLQAVLRRRVDPLLGARIDIEDILQETYIEARRRGLPLGPGSPSPYVWLYGIARQRLFDAWRREARGRRDLRRDQPWPEDTSVQFACHLFGAGTNPGEAIDRRELQDRVRLVLSTMSERDAEIIELRFLDDLSFAEAAEHLEISEDAAIKRCARAVLRFQECWKRLNVRADER